MNAAAAAAAAAAICVAAGHVALLPTTTTTTTTTTSLLFSSLLFVASNWQRFDMPIRNASPRVAAPRWPQTDYPPPRRPLITGTRHPRASAPASTSSYNRTFLAGDCVEVVRAFRPRASPPSSVSVIVIHTITRPISPHYAVVARYSLLTPTVTSSVSKAVFSFIHTSH